MRVVADFHIHSRFSRACSKELTLPNIAAACAVKGIDVVATGDFTHPQWRQEIGEQLVEHTPGIFKLQAPSPSRSPSRWEGEKREGTKFLLGTELSCIYKHDGKTRRVHHLVLAPSLTAVDRVISRLEAHGCNLRADGRPILGLSSHDLLSICLEADPRTVLIPAHAWTPWFAVFGSESGYDSLEECFGDLASHVPAIETGLSCYDKATEVLTEAGWKKFSKVRRSDRCCTLNVSTDQIEFQTPTKLFVSHYQGKMYQLKTKRVDLLVTPNHNLLYSPCDFRRAHPYVLRTAAQLFGKSKRLKKDGIWNGAALASFTLPAVIIPHGSRFYSGFRTQRAKRFPIIPWVKFFGFWIAEGWVHHGRNGNYGVFIANNNQRLLDEMEEVLKGFGYRVYRSDRTIRVRDCQLFMYLKQFGKSAQKFIPYEMKSLSRESLEQLLEYYLKGDGHRYGRRGKGLSATTTSVRLRDDLQEVALKVGMSAYYRRGRGRGTLIHSLPYKGRVYRQRATAWIVYFLRKNRPIILPSTIKRLQYTESWVDFDGPVYCVTVPNHVLYVRRNGIPLWCGNSDPAMNWRVSGLDRIALISSSDAHSLPNLGREATVLALEALTFDMIIAAIRASAPARYDAASSNRVIETIEFFPEEGKYHYDGHRLCGVRCTPAETKRHRGICPQCAKPMTVGVLSRVDKFADRAEGFTPHAPSFRRIVPLDEIIAEAFGVVSITKRVRAQYDRLTRDVGNEFHILLDADFDAIARVAPAEVIEAIRRVRAGELDIAPGYDGEYGTVRVFTENHPRPIARQRVLL